MILLRNKWQSGEWTVFFQPTPSTSIDVIFALWAFAVYRWNITAILFTKISPYIFFKSAFRRSNSRQKFGTSIVASVGRNSNRRSSLESHQTERRTFSQGVSFTAVSEFFPFSLRQYLWRFTFWRQTHLWSSLISLFRKGEMTPQWRRKGSIATRICSSVQTIHYVSGFWYLSQPLKVAVESCMLSKNLPS